MTKMNKLIKTILSFALLCGMQSAVWAGNVASVSNGGTITNYTTLSAAVSAWTSGTTLTLLDNVTTSDTIVVSAGDHVLDLHGYGIRMTGNKTILKVDQNVNLTMKDSNPSKVHYVTLSSYRGTGVSDTGTASTIVAGTGSGTVKITGGYLTGGVADGHPVESNAYTYGGAVHIRYGTFTMLGGTIVGNTASTSGAAIDSSGNGVINISGGRICYNKAESGAAVGIGSSGAAGSTIGVGYCNISDGTIDYNYATTSGTGCCAVRLNNGQLDLSGGRIENNSSGKGAGDLYYDRSGGLTDGLNKIFVSGNPVVNAALLRENTVFYGKSGSPLTSGAQIKVALMSSISGTNDMQFAKDFTKEDLNYFASNMSANAGIIYDDGSDNWVMYNSAPNKISNTNHTHAADTLWFSVAAGSSNVDGNINNSVASVTTSANVTTEYQTLSEAVAAWVTGSTLKLLSDCTTDVTISAPTGNSTLDLNGYGIRMTANKTILKVDENVNLTMKDSNPNKVHYVTLSSYRGTGVSDTGTESTIAVNQGNGVVKITGGYITGGVANQGMYGGTSYVSGGGVRVTSGTFTLQGGTVIGNTARDCGGGICISGSGVANIDGGRVCYNLALNGSGIIIGINGYANSVPGKGYLNMSGGIIDNNRSQGPSNVYAVISINNGTFDLSGGKIINNTASNDANGVTYGGLNLYISGNPVIKDNGTTKNIMMQSYPIYSKSGSPLTEGAELYITPSTLPTETADVKIAQGFSKEELKYFKSDLPDDCGVIFDDGTDNWVMYNSTVCKIINTHHTHAANTLWLSVAAASSNVEDNILVAASVTTSANVTTKYETLSEAVAAWVTGSTLKLLSDCTTDVTINAPSGNSTLDLNGYGIRMTADKRIIDVGQDANLTMKDSNKNKVHYVTLSSYRGTSVSNTGTISPVTAGTGTGVVMITGGYLTGGVADKPAIGYNRNELFTGGGVYVAYGTFTMQGGTIIGNKSNNSSGGGMHVSGKGTVNISGGRICYNKSDAGAAINLGINGYGLSSLGLGYLNMSGGTIDYNYGASTAATGGAIRINNGKFDLSGGSIINNSYVNSLGGIVYDERGALSGNKNQLIISGNPVVKNNGNHNIWLSGNSIIYAKAGSPLTSGAEVYISPYTAPSNTADVKIGNGFTKNDLRYFKSDNKKYENSTFDAGVIFDDGTNNWVMYNSTANKIGNTHHTNAANSLWLSVAAASSNVDGNILLPTATVTTSAGVSTTYEILSEAVEAWEAGSTLTLLRNVTITGAIEVSETKTFDLNGYGIKFTGTQDFDSARGTLVKQCCIFYIRTGGNLTLNDSRPSYTDSSSNRPLAYPSTTQKVSGGYLTGGKGGHRPTGADPNLRGGAVYINENSVFNMYGGTIIDNVIDVLDTYVGATNVGGAGVFIAGTFNMYGGAITHNSVYAHSKNAWGGAICVDKVFNMYGGRIEYNYIEGAGVKGGGVWGGFTNSVSGLSVIQNNKAKLNGGTEVNSNFMVNGNTTSGNADYLPVFKDLEPGSKIYFSTGTNATSTTDVQFAKQSDKESLRYVISDNVAAAGIVYDDGTHCWAYNSTLNRFVVINDTNHTHLAGSMWLSTKASSSDIGGNTQGGWEIVQGTEPNVLIANYKIGEDVVANETLNVTSRSTYLTEINTFSTAIGQTPASKVMVYGVNEGSEGNDSSIPSTPGLFYQKVALRYGTEDFLLILPRRLLVLRENSDNSDAIDSAASESSVDISITRTFGNNYNSLCLPFALTSSEVTALGLSVYKPDSTVDKGSSRIKFITTPVTSCEAGKPYIVKKTGSASWPVFENKTVVASPVDITLQGIVVKGTFSSVESPEAADKTKLVISSDGKGFTFVKSGDTTDLRAFRAWFEKK